MAEEKKQPSQSEGFSMDFSTFVLSLNASALIHLGELPDPGSKERTVSLPTAKHTIEILEIIKEKTKGNLDGEEEKLLDDVLYNLRLSILKAVSLKRRVD